MHFHIKIKYFLMHDVETLRIMKLPYGISVSLIHGWKSILINKMGLLGLFLGFLKTCP